VAETNGKVLHALNGIRVLLESHSASLVSLQQQRRDAGEHGPMILRRLTEIERLVRGDPGLAQAPKLSRSRPLGV
jgi:hypothetical protein